MAEHSKKCLNKPRNVMVMDADNEGFKLLSKLFTLQMLQESIDHVCKGYTRYVSITQGTQVTSNAL